MSDLAKVLSIIPHLDRGERSLVIRSIKALDSLMPKGQDPATKVTAENDLELSCIVRHLQSLGLPADHTFVMRYMNAYKVFRKAAPLVRTYLEKAIPSMSRVEYHAVLMLSLRSLTGLMVREQRSITTRTIMFNYPRIPTALSLSFPGYAESGLLGRIIRIENPMERKSNVRTE